MMMSFRHFSSKRSFTEGYNFNPRSQKIILSFFFIFFFKTKTKKHWTFHQLYPLYSFIFIIHYFQSDITMQEEQAYQQQAQVEEENVTVSEY